MMKRLYSFLLMVVVTMTCFMPAAAQKDNTSRWQLHYGLGGLSLPDVVGALLAGLGSIDIGNEVESHSFAPFCNPNIGLEYALNEKLSLGGSVAVGTARAWTTFTENGQLSKSSECWYPSLCISLSNKYVQKENYRMYGHWGLGAALFSLQQSNHSDSTGNQGLSVVPMVNLYPLCFAWGKSAGFQLECGWGANGIVNVGGYWSF